MSNNDYMYAIDRSDEYLAHYGIKGMKWGVRKAIASGNSRALARQYRKASRKLAKLQRQASSGKKYARRAAALGAGAALAGGAAVAGTQGIASGMAKLGAHGGQAMVRGGNALKRAGSGLSTALYKAGAATGNTTLKKLGAHGGQAMIKAGSAINKAGTGMSTGLYGASNAVRNWGNGTQSVAFDTAATKALRGKQAAVDRNAARVMQRQLKSGNIQGVGKTAMDVGYKNAGYNKAIEASKQRYTATNNTLARVGAGALAAGLAGAAGYNAYRAATTKKAAKRAEEFQREMNKAFKGTQYANNGGAKQTKSKKRRRR